ncbi:MAG: STAS domain-containing protein [Opitutaceae bacterium]|nr:STAS domain-containing protein [Opitutaceae bacterium]
MFADTPQTTQLLRMSFLNRHHTLQLKITAAAHGNDLVITLDGALSAGDAVAAQVELLNLSAPCTGRIVLDCTRLTYVASVGIRALLALHRNASGRSVTVTLAGVTETVRNILEVAGLLKHFTLIASLNDLPPAPTP